MTVLDWADLTPDQETALIGTLAPSIAVGCELLNFDLTLAQDLSEALDTTTGDVAWDGTALVHRDVSLTIAADLAWGIALVRIYRIVTDTVTGLSARRNRGVFCLTTPDQPAGAQIENAQSPIVGKTAYTVTGLDRTYLLDRLVGYSYYIAAATNVLTALAQAYSDAGLPGFLIDGSASASVLPTDMTWPLVSSGADDTSSTDVTSYSADPAIAAANSAAGSATWRTVINDLHSLISYRAVWADDDGNLRSTPYADPSTRAPQRTLDTTDPIASLVSPDRTITKDLWGAPNRWIFVWSNMPPDISGNQQTPDGTNGGIYEVNNYTDGPSSQTARNGLVYTSQIEFTAASADDLIAQGDAKVAADKRVVQTFKITTTPAMVTAGHFDVFDLLDPAIDGGAAKVQATSWTESFTNDDTAWTLESV